MKDWAIWARTGPGLGAQLVRALLGSAGLRVVGLVFGFLVGVQLARGLGPAGYGVYGTAMALISVLMLPTELGLPQLVTREVASIPVGRGNGGAIAVLHWARKKVLLSSAIIAVALMAVLLSGAWQVNTDLRNALIVGLVWIPVVAFGNVYSAVLRGIHLISLGQIGEFLVRPVLVSVFLLLLVQLSGISLSPASAMLINVVAAAAAAGVSIYYLRRSLGSIGKREDVLLPQGLAFTQALPMAMSEGMRVIAAQVGILLLAAMSTEAEVGRYRVAYAIYTASTMPSALINIACAPMMARLFTEGRVQELARLNIWISLFLLASASLFLIAGLAMGVDGISFIFGPVYRDAAPIMIIFFAGELVASLFGHPTVLLNMMRQQRVVMWWSIAALAVNVVVALLLIPTLGGAGAALSVAGGLIIWRAGCALFAKLSLGLNASVLTKLIPVMPGRRGA